MQLPDFKTLSIVVQQTVQQSLQHRAELLSWILLESIPFLVFFMLWLAIFSTRTELNGVTLSQTLSYYITIFLLNQITNVSFESSWADKIRTGGIDHLLIKPLPLLLRIVFQDFGQKLVSLVLIIPLLLVVFSVGISNHFIESGILMKLANIEFVVSLLGAYIIQLLLGLIVVLTAFWLAYANGMNHFKMVVISVFSGTIMPPALMPEWLQKITFALPFKFTYAIPAMISTGYHLTPQDWLYFAGTIIALLWVVQTLWINGLKRYGSEGG